ncbi:hypothetical protein C8Q80DRAFT_441793 [Daedaleopsis nitida]|nr:hypothetical protein C8Q80DRAFT_441793 [Daedaleopsis nitida]
MADLVPIHNLPNEILVEIFLMHAAASRTFSLAGTSGYKHRPHPRRALGWVSLMRVCRHWREVALATPTLWQIVDVNKTTTWLKLAIDRSCNAPLELYLHVCDVALDSIPLILTQAHRLRKLLLPPFKRSDLPALKILFQTVMPLLNELRIHLDIWENETTSTRISIGSLDDCFPSLRSVRLENFTVAWALPAMSRMRYLNLHNCETVDENLTFNQFLDTLEACTELEDLRLHGFVSTIAHRVPAGFARAVFLPRLQRLTISEPPALCRQLLSVIHLPPTIILRVIGQIDPSLDPHDTHHLFPSMLPEDLSKLPVIQSLKHASVENNNDVVVLQLWSGSRYSNDFASVILKLDCGLETFEGYMPHAIEDFVHLFSSAPIENVYVSCRPGEVHTSATWALLFAALPAVHTLTVSSGLTLELVWHALAGRQLPLLEVDEDAARAFSPVLLPNLQSLKVEDLDWSEDAMGYVLESLRRRARRGLPQLDELTIEFFRPTGDRFRVQEEIERVLPFYEKSMEEFAKRFAWGWT